MRKESSSSEIIDDKDLLQTSFFSLKVAEIYWTLIELDYFPVIDTFLDVGCPSFWIRNIGVSSSTEGFTSAS